MVLCHGIKSSSWVSCTPVHYPHRRLHGRRRLVNPGPHLADRGVSRKSGETFLGVPMLRILAFLGVDIGFPYLGKLPHALSRIQAFYVLF